MQALEVSLKEASTHLYDVSGERWLDVRLAHLAGHMGNFQAEQRNSSQDLEQCLEITRAKYEESVQIRDRVLRQMEGGSGCASPVEVFSTKSLGYLDVANQYRGICQAWLTKATGSGDRLAWYQFFEAFDNLDTAVQRARFELELNERYCNVFRTLLPILSLGTALKELWRVGTYAADAEEVLEYHCQNLFREYIHRGERLMRRQNDSWEVVKSQVEDPFRCWCAFHASDLPPEN